MKCKHCNNLTTKYQINQQNGNNIYFPVCNHHISHRFPLGELPTYLPPEQGLKYLNKLQRNTWLNLCQN